MTTTPEQPISITKISLNVVPRAMRAIEIAAELTGDSRTDTINRAVQLYAYAMKVRAEGGKLLVADAQGDVHTLDID